MRPNEVWVKLSEGGLYSHKTNFYAVIRKLKRGGYSLRWVERGFNGYTVSSKTKRFEKLEDIFDEVPPEDIYRAIRNHPEKEEAREVWAEELLFLGKLLGRPVSGWKPNPKPTRQITLAEVIS